MPGTSPTSPVEDSVAVRSSSYTSIAGREVEVSPGGQVEESRTNSDAAVMLLSLPAAFNSKLDGCSGVSGAEETLGELENEEDEISDSQRDL